MPNHSQNQNKTKSDSAVNFTLTFKYAINTVCIWVMCIHLILNYGTVNVLLNFKSKCFQSLLKVKSVLKILKWNCKMHPRYENEVGWTESLRSNISAEQVSAEHMENFC